MRDIPSTRPSLLLRLSDGGDTAAWLQFVALYEPALYRFARSKGWQHADAEDLVQTVLTSLAQKVGEWDTSQQKGSFRGWLLRVAQNASIDAFRARQRRKVALFSAHDKVVNDGSGDPNDGLEHPLPQHELSAPEDFVTQSDSGLIQEYRRELLQQGAEAIRSEFQEKTWLAFVWTHLEGMSVDEAAQGLGLSKASVYAARSRIVARLRSKVREMFDA